MFRKLIVVASLLLLSCRAFAQTITPAPELLNFQGRLAKPDGTPVLDGTYTLRFSLWSAASGGTEKWFQVINTVAVRNGVFGVLLGNGNPITANVVNGSTYLEVKVGNDPPLTPRQQITSVAYALKANTVPDASITNAKITAGTLTADRFATGAFNATAWLLTGNSGTNPATQFLGTTDLQPLLLKTNNLRGLSLIYQNDGAGTIGMNVLGGYWGNLIASNATAATVFGGSDFDGGAPNIVYDTDGTISGGENNTVGFDDSDPSVDFGATVSGGVSNTADTTYATVGGGGGNLAGNGAATVAGGYLNGVVGFIASIGGGRENLASGDYSTIAGGRLNTAAGSYSMAAGGRANAANDGTFVWRSYNGTDTTDFTSTGANQFLISAPGGVGIGTNDPAGFALHVAGTGKFDGNLTVTSTTYTSDARYKTHIADLSNPLDVVLNLRGVSYEWDKANWSAMHFPEGGQIGFLAQEVEKVLPELVKTDEKGYKSVNYIGVVPIAVEAIKTLNARSVVQQKTIETLRSDNAAIRQENADLRSALETLAKRLDTLEKRTSGSRQ